MVGDDLDGPDDHHVHAAHLGKEEIGVVGHDPAVVDDMQQCFEKNPEDVAITYIDTRVAVWPLQACEQELIFLHMNRQLPEANILLLI